MSKDTSKELQELEAKLLFDKLTRRAKLLATLQRRRYKFVVLFLVCIFGCTFVWPAFDSNDGPALLLILLAIYVAHMETRMNALVKLLQEDGMLQGTPATLKHVGEP